MKLLEPMVYVLGRIGVPVRVGEVRIVEEAKTSGPVPISFETEDNNSAEVIDEAAVP